MFYLKFFCSMISSAIMEMFASLT
uniref:Uncharacterized protein n=1 Tax=Rhizophora mucronata TaxID=61149 RepID=A0A2P2IZN3_RHIMU